ncbi:TPA: hypothetical protein N0F65_002049 [Lagenidium giganteum]|uniref:RanBP2-type domain-containing protein n=1 Tax=Lagenidium giganteum TaxID=4803 RepID=A0AAV2ZGY0_9STRA|nr:TPA: hypothetical protein N0F65_002049 [Lagenidium giganteum]
MLWKRVCARLTMSANEWSCSLCTLINNIDDQECAACGQARPRAASTRKAASIAEKPASLPLTRSKPGALFFFTSTNGPTWRTSRLLAPPAPTRDEGRENTMAVETTRDAMPSLATTQLMDNTTRDVGTTQSPGDVARPPIQGIYDQPPDDEPSFQLLGPSNMSFALEPPEVAESVNDAPTQPMQATAADAVSNDKDAEFARAGLDMSDSEDEDDNPRVKHLRRRNHVEDEPDAFEQDAIEGPTWECPVCTNFNSEYMPRCELCETPRPVNGPARDFTNQNDVVDLAGENDDEFDYGAASVNENPYAPVFDDHVEEPNGAGYDSPDDISDGEFVPDSYDYNAQRTPLRPHLQEFQHFVCVEDLNTDPGCAIDYRNMFAGTKRGKHYDDRLSKRRRESQKRKRAQQAQQNQQIRNLDAGIKVKQLPLNLDGKVSLLPNLVMKRNTLLTYQQEQKHAQQCLPRYGGRQVVEDRLHQPLPSGSIITIPVFAHWIHAAPTDRFQPPAHVSTSSTFVRVVKRRVDPTGRPVDEAPATWYFNARARSSDTRSTHRLQMTTLEEAKAFLKKDGGDGTNLYDHLSEVLLKILVERPESLHDSFEYISTAVKQQRYLPAGAHDGQDSALRKDAKEKQERWCNLALDLLKIKSEEEASAERVTGVADMLDEANMFEWAGIGFSRSEVFRLSVSLQKLAQANGTISMRFWGKILGYGADFYIAEGEVPGQSEPEDANAEEGAAGANKFTYWAMVDNGTYEWTRLPNVQRDQILIARQLRRFVHANLEGKVVGHPPFPGLEKHFLRAQIARISSSTVICPAGYFQTNEVGEIEPAAEPEIKTAQQLADLSSWVHFSKEINARYGRASPLPPRTGPDGEDLPWEGEEFVPPLRGLNEDNPNSWRVDRLPATLVPSVGEFAVVRSLTWPGAVSIAVGKKFLNVYVGHGTKFSRDPYQLQHPKQIQVGFGIGIGEDLGLDVDEKQGLRFDPLVEQTDILEDPTPPEPEE